jgi:hypothetical protein
MEANLAFVGDQFPQAEQSIGPQCSVEISIFMSSGEPMPIHCAWSESCWVFVDWVLLQYHYLESQKHGYIESPQLCGTIDAWVMDSGRSAQPSRCHVLAISDRRRFAFEKKSEYCPVFA